MEPLKEMFNAAFYRHFTNVFQKISPEFRGSEFYKEAVKDLADRELNQRLRHTTILLKKYLPGDFKSAVKVMKEAAQYLKRGYTSLVLPDYVGLYGKDDLHFSLEALRFFTSFGSSEFAVRGFLKTDLHTTLNHMERWADDENPHVRRLASEGSRPRLPWSFRITEIIKQPSLTKTILEKLKADDELYVRKSVANHLNDISKDHPDYFLELVGRWNLDDDRTRWIVKHASRTLIKKGDARALRLFSFSHKAGVALRKFYIKPASLKLGGQIEFGFEIENKENTEHRFAVDYAIIYRRPGNSTSRKVFKLKEIKLGDRESFFIVKTQVFRDFSTRKHYEGKHKIEIIVNGNTLLEKSFHLTLK